MTTGRWMRRLTVAALAMCAALGLELGTATAQTRIKDIVDFEGVRENMLIGYGLVVGLNGTGDDLDGANFTRESLVGMLARVGVNPRADELEPENVAARLGPATSRSDETHVGEEGV